MTKQRHVGRRPTNNQAHEKPSTNVWQEVQQWSELLSRRTRQFDDLLGALHSLSQVTRNKDQIKEIISLLANLSKKQSAKSGSASGGQSQGSQGSLTGNLFYDLFNSPAMKNIVGEVLKSKSKKRW
jgi:ABC-type branched-subunit amino acid transport system ATPase component